VLHPKGRYKGQKLRTLVTINIPAITSKMIAAVPLIWFVKYKLMMIMADTIRTLRSRVPIFGFMAVLPE
jgi:hypothetical protein